MKKEENVQYIMILPKSHDRTVNIGSKDMNWIISIWDKFFIFTVFI